MINEIELFKYVFARERLDAALVAEIEREEVFRDSINYFEELKSALQQKISFDVKKKLAAKIPIYNFNNEIELHEVKIPSPKNGGQRLAAATKELTNKPYTKTFIDENGEFIVKVLNNTGKTKVFIFSTNDDSMKNFKLSVQPLDKEYSFEDNSIQLELESDVEVESVKLIL